METRELRIEIPKGFEIDKENSTFEKIIFKKKDTKPRSWEEYCEQYENIPSYTLGYDVPNCAVPSKKLAEAFLAMMQLMSLRQAWIGDWKPDWKTTAKKKLCILFQEDKIAVDYFYSDAHPLSFPTQEMATDFMNCFKDLLEIAKPLI